MTSTTSETEKGFFLLQINEKRILVVTWEGKTTTPYQAIDRLNIPTLKPEDWGTHRLVIHHHVTAGDTPLAVGIPWNATCYQFIKNGEVVVRFRGRADGCSTKINSEKVAGAPGKQRGNKKQRVALLPTESTAEVVSPT